MVTRYFLLTELLLIMYTWTKRLWRFFLYGRKYAVLNLNGLMGKFSTCIHKVENLQLSDWNFSNLISFPSDDNHFVMPVC